VKTTALSLTLAGALILGCGGGRRSAPEAAPAAKAAAPAPLWTFAPESWIAAVVVGDGVGARIDRGADEIRRIVTDAGAATSLEQLRSLFLAPSGIDVLDPSSLESAGIDIGQGAAFFLTPDFQIAAVFSVRDRATFVSALGGRGSTHGDEIQGARCGPARGRYLCAAPVLWDALAGGTSSPGRAVDGDIEVDVRAPTGTGDLIAALGGPLVGLRAAHVSVTLERGRISSKAEIDIDAPAGWLSARRRSAPRAFTEIDRGAFGFVRLRVPEAELRRLPWPKMGPVDLRDVLAPELTGDIAVVSSGSHPLGVHVVAGLKNGGPVKVTLRTACRLAGYAGLGSFSWRNERCEGQADLRKLGAPPALLAWLPRKAPVFVQVTARAAIVSLMVPPEPGAATAGASGAVAKRVHGADWNVSGWGRWADPELVMTGSQAQAFRDQLAAFGRPELVAAARALMAHVYDAGFGIRATDSGLVIEGSMTTFASDEEDAYAAYSKAAIALGRGDLPAYVRAIAAIASRHPRSLAARQATVRGLPLAPLAGLGALLDHLPWKGQ